MRASRSLHFGRDDTAGGVERATRMRASPSVLISSAGNAPDSFSDPPAPGQPPLLLVRSRRWEQAGLGAWMPPVRDGSAGSVGWGCGGRAVNPWGQRGIALRDRGFPVCLRRGPPPCVQNRPDASTSASGGGRRSRRQPDRRRASCGGAGSCGLRRGR